MDNKVYVIIDNCVWNDEENNRIVAVTPSRDLAKQIMKNYIEVVKREIDYDDLDISEDGIDDGFIVDESDDSWVIYSNGEYSSYHSSISINEKELIDEKEYNEEYEI